MKLQEAIDHLCELESGLKKVESCLKEATDIEFPDK